MARKTVKLHMPKGTDEVNYGTESFPVDHDGEVEVPVEAAGPLLKEGGAIEEMEEEEVVNETPEGWVKIGHRFPGASIGYGGLSYTCGDDGTVLVPAHFMSFAEDHGFFLVKT